MISLWLLLLPRSDQQPPQTLEVDTMKLCTHPLGPDLELPRVATDRDLATRLRHSFHAIAPAADALVDKFYERLFAAHPTVRKLFPEDMSAQKKKLWTMLQWVIANLDSGPLLRARLRELGERHKSYSALPEHYPIVANTLLAAMADVAGPGWNNQVEADWRTVLERMAAIMLGQP